MTGCKPCCKSVPCNLWDIYTWVKHEMGAPPHGMATCPNEMWLKIKWAAVRHWPKCIQHLRECTWGLVLSKQCTKRARCANAGTKLKALLKEEMHQE